MDIEEYVFVNSEGFLLDFLSMLIVYQKMKVLCLNISCEVCIDIEIYNKYVFFRLVVFRLDFCFDCL